MTDQEQIDTVVARLNDCVTNKEKFITLGMFVDDPMYSVGNIKIAQKKAGIAHIADLLGNGDDFVAN